MSRIGNKPVAIPAGVKVNITGNVVNVEGPKGKLTYTVPAIIKVEATDSAIEVVRPDDLAKSKAMHGLSRSLINNMVIGVSAGYKKELEMRGVGYKAQLKGKTLVLSVGFSHEINFEIPEGITITVPAPTQIAVEGYDKQQVGQVAATIRGYRKPEPYKGKGIRYVGEHVAQKEGKKVG